MGNGIDLFEVIEKYGVDVFRFIFVIGILFGNDIRFYMEKVEVNRNFVNKIWNVVRFVFMNFDIDISFKFDESKFIFIERWILFRFDIFIREVIENFEKFEIGIVV